MALTETWLGTDVDNIVLGDLIPDGYDLYHVPRQHQRGGGVALIYNKSLSLNKMKQDTIFTNFEHLECTINTQTSNMRLCVAYRPPALKNNNMKISVFFEEWSKYINQREELLITGDLNFHLDKPTDPSTQKFMSIHHEHGLTQHVNEPTHAHCHILDVVITRDNSNISQSSPSIDDNYLSDSKGISSVDHKGISTILHISKPPKSRKTVSYRKYRATELADLASDIESTIIFHSEEMPLDDLVRNYNDIIRAAVDKHAPVQTKVVTLRPSTQWYSQELHAGKEDKRKAERVWRRTKLEVHRQIFQEKCNASSRLLFQNKHD